MIKTVLALLMTVSLFGQSLTFSNNGSLTIFPLTPHARGADIVSMFNTLNSAPFKLVQSQIAIQTTKNGLIPNIQFITPMNNFTILIVGYLQTNSVIPPGVVGGRAGTNNRFGYIAIAVEQIVEMIYSPVIMSPASVFTSQALAGTLPIFSVDLGQRTADIIQAVTLLNTPPIADRGFAVNPVSLLTTLNGPYYIGTTGGAPIMIGGVIPQVQSIAAVAPNSTLMLVTFKPLYSNSHLASGGFASIALSPDQVTGIVFAQN